MAKPWRWGLALAVALPSVWLAGTPTAQARSTQFFMAPQVNDRDIWPCTHSEEFPEACSKAAVNRAATEFCLDHGYMRSAEYYIESVEFIWERFPVVGWTERRDESGKVRAGWEDKGERYDRFTAIECQSF